MSREKADFLPELHLVCPGKVGGKQNKSKLGCHSQERPCRRDAGAWAAEPKHQRCGDLGARPGIGRRTNLVAINRTLA